MLDQLNLRVLTSETRFQRHVPQVRFNANEIVFNDYMGVTLFRDVSIVHVKGLLNYILQLPSLVDDSLVINKEWTFLKERHDLNVRCAMIASKEYCKSYAIKTI